MFQCITITGVVENHAELLLLSNSYSMIMTEKAESLKIHTGKTLQKCKSIIIMVRSIYLRVATGILRSKFTKPVKF